MGHEEAFVRAFIIPEKRARYLDRLGRPSARRKFMSQNFHHMTDLDERYAQKLDPHVPLVEWKNRGAAHIDRIYELLRERDAPSRSYVISATSNLDGQEADLRDALENVVGSNDGTFISCIPGRLAYFEGEGLNERFILERP